MDLIPTAARSSQRPSTADLDHALTAQLAVAWAGEGGEEPRLGWWRCDMTGEFTGQILLEELLPTTWRWASLQAAREAARRADAALRSRDARADRIHSLFHLGFGVDEQLDERFQDLKRGGTGPRSALPDLAPLLTDSWDPEAFSAWLAGHGDPRFTAAPIGRRLPGPPPPLPEAIDRLLAALAPPSPHYPLPHFRADA